MGTPISFDIETSPSTAARRWRWRVSRPSYRLVNYIIAALAATTLAVSGDTHITPAGRDFGAGVDSFSHASRHASLGATMQKTASHIGHHFSLHFAISSRSPAGQEAGFRPTWRAAPPALLGATLGAVQQTHYRSVATRTNYIKLIAVILHVELKSTFDGRSRCSLRLPLGGGDTIY